MKVRSTASPRRAWLAFSIAGAAACNTFSGANDFTFETGTDIVTNAGSPAGDGGVDAERSAAPSDAAVSTGTDPDAGKPEPETPEAGTVSVVVPNGVDFGDVPCGTTPTARQIEIHNDTASDVAFTATLQNANSGSFTISPISGEAQAGQVFQLTLGAKKVSGSPGKRTQSLTLSTGAPSPSSRDYNVTLNAVGAQFSTPSAPTWIDFGDVDTTDLFGDTRTVVVRNDGSLAGTIQASLLATAFSVSPSSAKISAGGNATFTITAKPFTTGYQSGTLSFSSGSGTCGNTPSSITVSCTGK